MLLAARGFQVTIVEKDAQVGGRNAALLRNGYNRHRDTFDLSRLRRFAESHVGARTYRRRFRHLPG